jgi:NADH-quinone oxidoreductase subunit G
MEQPLAGNRIRKAALKGGKIMFINLRDFDFRFPVAAKVIADPLGMIKALAGVAKAIADLQTITIPNNFKALLEQSEVSGAHQVMAEHLCKAEDATVLLGNQAFSHPDFAQLRILANFIAQASNARQGYKSEAANSVGAWLSGAVPHRSAGGKEIETMGLDALAMLDSPRKAYVLIGIEPEFDCWNSSAATKAVQAAEFVVSISAFLNSTIKNYSHVVLPAALFAETSGTYVNSEGRWQSFQGACQPLGEARPIWKILRVLGNHLNLEGFDYFDSREVLKEVQQQCSAIEPSNALNSDLSVQITKESKLMRIADVPIYAVDAVVRRAWSLQQTPLAEPAQIKISTEDAKKLGLHNIAQARIQQNGSSLTLPLILDDSIPRNCVWVSPSIQETTKLGPPIGQAEISAA